MNCPVCRQVVIEGVEVNGFEVHEGHCQAVMHHHEAVNMALGQEYGPLAYERVEVQEKAAHNRAKAKKAHRCPYTFA